MRKATTNFQKSHLELCACELWEKELKVCKRHKNVWNKLFPKIWYTKLHKGYPK